MSTIRETVSANLSPSYMSYAEPVIAALDERETAIKAGLAQYASDRGLSTNEVNALFVEVGLSQPEPEPVEDPTTDEGTLRQVLDTVAGLSRTVQSLVDAARSHGITLR